MNVFERGNPPAASRHPPLTRGALAGGGEPGDLGAAFLRGHPHPPPSGAPSPLKGEGLRAADSRPYREGEIFWDGRVRTPAPTKFGESSGFAVRADGLGGPRAHSVRPYSKGRPYGDIRMSQTGPREGQAPPLQLSRNSSGMG